MENIHSNKNGWGWNGRRNFHPPQPKAGFLKNLASNTRQDNVRASLISWVAVIVGVEVDELGKETALCQHLLNYRVCTVGCSPWLVEVNDENIFWVQRRVGEYSFYDSPMLFFISGGDHLHWLVIKAVGGIVLVHKVAKLFENTNRALDLAVVKDNNFHGIGLFGVNVEVCLVQKGSPVFSLVLWDLDTSCLEHRKRQDLGLGTQGSIG
mmetsp:Transcript_15314/g.38593  ORF Transcript_15314/g.38593 Transcript_15314/m.38593 type:complete len:209 (+) Transcript_15314:2701-3327(+)